MIPRVCNKTDAEPGIILFLFSIMVLLSVIIGLFGLLFCFIIYLVCGWYKGKWKTLHKDLTALEEDSGRRVRNPCCDYDRYKERVPEREMEEVQGFERERVNIRKRSLIDNNLACMQHVVLIPPKVETNESNQNLIQNNRVSSTTNDDQLQPVNSRLFSINFILKMYISFF